MSGELVPRTRAGRNFAATFNDDPAFVRDIRAIEEQAAAAARAALFEKFGTLSPPEEVWRDSERMYGWTTARATALRLMANQ